MFLVIFLVLQLEHFMQAWVLLQKLTQIEQRNENPAFVIALHRLIHFKRSYIKLFIPSHTRTQHSRVFGA